MRDYAITTVCINCKSRWTEYVKANKHNPNMMCQFTVGGYMPDSLECFDCHKFGTQLVVQVVMISEDNKLRLVQKTKCSMCGNSSQDMLVHCKLNLCKDNIPRRVYCLHCHEDHINDFHDTYERIE